MELCSIQPRLVAAGFTGSGTATHAPEGRRKWAADSLFECVDVHSVDSKVDAALTREGGIAVQPSIHNVDSILQNLQEYLGGKGQEDAIQRQSSSSRMGSFLLYAKAEVATLSPRMCFTECFCLCPVAPHSSVYLASMQTHFGWHVQLPRFLPSAHVSQHIFHVVNLLPAGRNPTLHWPPLLQATDVMLLIPLACLRIVSIWDEGSSVPKDESLNKQFCFHSFLRNIRISNRSRRPFMIQKDHVSTLCSQRAKG